MILLVDDEPLVLKSLGSLIESYGYTVRKANSADQAMEFIQDPTVVVDLVLTDQVMPEKDGISLLHSIRRIRPFLKASMVVRRPINR